MLDNSLEIAGQIIAPGKKQRLEIPVGRLPTQTLLSLPVTVLNGKEAGPKLWLSAAIHGDELNGVEIIRQVVEKINPKLLKGTLIAVPIVNVFGFIEQSRYLPDRRDLNRSFPGSANGSLASRLAYLFMEEIVNRSTHGIDLHTAAVPRVNLPQIRANLDDEETYNCAKAFNAPVMMHSTIRDGSLREAATKKDIPILLYEAGEALRFDEEAIRVGVEGVLRVINFLQMYSFPFANIASDSVEIRESKWIRATKGGILRLEVKLGDKVVKKQLLGLTADAFGEKHSKIRSPVDGIVISLTQNPLVNLGDGIVHIAINAT